MRLGHRGKLHDMFGSVPDGSLVLDPGGLSSSGRPRTGSGMLTLHRGTEISRETGMGCEAETRGRNARADVAGAESTARGEISQAR